jgi:hypothetical protein
MSRYLGPKASVVTGSLAEARCFWSHFRQTSHGITHLIAPFGRRPGVGSTVISRCVTGISAGPPQMIEVPNPSVDVDSWEG